MTREREFETELPGGMTHVVQVQPDRDDVDFDLHVLDGEGNEVARDDSPAAGATCTFDTDEGGVYRLRIVTVRGSAGFSVSTSSRSRGVGLPASPPEAENRADGPFRLPEAPPAAAPEPPAAGRSGLSDAERDALLAAHNRWRERFDVPPLVWSGELAAVAQDWADTLAAGGMSMRHRSPNRFGENIFWCSGRAAEPSDVVDAWGNEVELYDPDKNNWWPHAGHWSQLVWRTTTLVGGGVARRDGQEMWVCNYDPRGNWTGERPY